MDDDSKAGDVPETKRSIQVLVEDVICVILPLDKDDPRATFFTTEGKFVRTGPFASQEECWGQIVGMLENSATHVFTRCGRLAFRSDRLRLLTVEESQKFGTHIRFLFDPKFEYPVKFERKEHLDATYAGIVRILAGLQDARASAPLSEGIH